MINHQVFYERIEKFCKQCKFWTGRQCRKGHLPSSSTGCPLKLFPPVNAASYDEDREADFVEESMSCCGQNTDMPDLSWRQVLAHFAQSMVRWSRSGMPIVSDHLHAQRHAKCMACPDHKGFWCKKCKCVCYLKTKLATEGCPAQPPRWLPLG